jgi:hypothetical protein
MAAGEERRHDDAATIDGLALRVMGLESRMENVELNQRLIASNQERATVELRANTGLTKQIHEGLYGREDSPGLASTVEDMRQGLYGHGGDDKGMKGKVEDMHDIFDEARSGLRFVGRVADGLTKVAKPFAFIAAFFGAAFIYAKTGVFKWPPW